MLRCYIDHLVISASSLETGVEYVHQVLGVRPQMGGEHPAMGTHNCLLKLGERLYLEVIAINPNAPQPDRPRWFQLDQQSSSQPIRMATWIARTDDIHAATAAAPIALGSVEPMSRGQMNWLITIPADGGLPLHGVVPSLIQWPVDMHPATKLPESGCSLLRLEGFHPEANKIVKILEAIGFSGNFQAVELPAEQKPYLVAHIRTPNGIRQLSAATLS